ncbi:MAG: DUF2807 domain-containing protein [Bacteroidetes bacterium]|nr:MAG: DUF2807 domain-containing protein [Bacteroidota bacterium]
MQKISLFVFLFIGLASFIHGQTVRQIGPFDEIVLSGDLDVKLEQSDVNEVHIDDRDGLDNAVTISIQGRRLKISLLDNWIRRDSRSVRVLVRYQRLVDIRALAGAEVEVSETLTTDKLRIKVGSGAELWIDVRSNILEGNVSEGGKLTISGTTRFHEASAATGGIYDASQLQSEETMVKANTGGEATVVATKLLDAVANTGGQVRYMGEPEQKYMRSNLAGEIRRF